MVECGNLYGDIIFNKVNAMSKSAKIFLIVLAVIGVGIYSFFWYVSKQPSKPLQDITPQDVENYKKDAEKLTNLPSKISDLPSIGATREEFGKTFKAYSGNGSDYVRYNNDGILVMFDGDRAISVTLQPLAENNYLGGINPRDFLPSDTVQIEEKKVGITYEAKASSKLLEQVYPKSKGKFGAGAMYKENGDVISVTISIGH